MQRRFALVFFFLAIIAAPAHADSGPAPDDLKQALAAEEVVVDGYRLDEEGLNAFYAARDFRPAWNFTNVGNNAAFTAFLDSTTQLIAWHGLQSRNYPLDLMRKLAAANDEDSRLKLEMLVTDTLLRLAHDLHGDAIDLDQLYPGWNFHRAAIDIPGMLAKAVAADSVNEFLDDLMPKNPAYRELARALQLYRAIAAEGEWPHIDPGPKLAPQDRSPRVAQLRARLAAEGYLPAAPPGNHANVFGETLRKAVAAYQLRNGLVADGHAGDKTIEALNIPVATRIDQIRANMERWRHMPEDFPPARAVIVNIPDAEIEILKDSTAVYRGPVIVGQVERKTPFIQSVIRSMIINPAWHVPAKIAREDILPKLRNDPHYLEKLGFVIRGSEDDPHGENIDWKNMPDEEFNFRLRQQPGSQNSLGRLKFDFDNDFAVYLHGTPHQELFSKNERALSSGCVRLRDPEMVAQIVLGDTPGDWDVAHIEAAIAARKTRWLEVKNAMPIYIVYWTVFTDEAGRIEFRNDVYDYDRFLMESLKSGAEAAELPSKPDAKP